MRAESGASALDALRQMKLRGDLVAVILADYRMPEMNGIEFLEQAMDIYPGARRVLLTAYADTGAAIDAINVVDLDHYLLKPWDPPEEKLYPVVDALLDAWHDLGPPAGAGDQGRRAPLVGALVGGPRVPGAQPGALPLVRLRRAGGAAAAQAAAGGRAGAAGGDHAGRRAADRADRRRAGRAGRAGHHAVQGLLRPDRDRRRAGRLGAAVYGASEGLRTVLVERTATGGQAGQSSRIENYLGFPDGVSGAQLTDRARRQATKFGAEVLTTREVIGLEVQRLGAAGHVRGRDVRSTRTPSSWPPGCPTGSWTRPGWPT